MIKFIAIECQNFLSFQQLPKTNIADLGLVFVKGCNEDDADADSNDSGKSNLFNLITWVLFERLAKVGDLIVGDGVVNSITGKDCFGRIWLERGGKVYVITRYRKMKGKRNTVEIDGGIDAAGSRAATNAEIEKILGMTYRMFTSSVFWAQGDAARKLTQLTDLEYKELFDELVGTANYEEKRQKVVKKIAELEGAIQLLDIDIARTQGKIDTAQNYLDNSIVRWPDVPIDELEFAYNQYTSANGSVSSLKAKLSSAQYLRSNKDNQRTNLLNERNRLLAEEKTVNKEVIEKKCSRCQQKLVTADSVTNIRQIKQSIPQQLAAIDVKIADIDKKIKEMDADNKKVEEQAKGFVTIMNANWNKCQQLVPEELLETMDVWEAIVAIKADRNKKSTDGLEAELVKNKALLARLQSDRTMKLAEIKDFEYIKKAYGSSGMKAMRLEELNPLLNQKAEEYSQKISGGAIRITFSSTTETKRGDVRDRYSVTVEKDDGVDFRLSGGGMITRANLIGAFALDEVRMMMTGLDISLKVYDEPSEGLDAAGELTTVNLIREQLNGTSFFVSHKSLVGDNNADAIWTVNRKNKVSQLSCY